MGILDNNIYQQNVEMKNQSNLLNQPASNNNKKTSFLNWLGIGTGNNMIQPELTYTQPTQANVVASEEEQQMIQSFIESLTDKEKTMYINNPKNFMEEYTDVYFDNKKLPSEALQYEYLKKLNADESKRTERRIVNGEEIFFTPEAIEYLRVNGLDPDWNEQMKLQEEFVKKWVDTGMMETAGRKPVDSNGDGIISPDEQARFENGTNGTWTEGVDWEWGKAEKHIPSLAEKKFDEVLSVANSEWLEGSMAKVDRNIETLNQALIELSGEGEIGGAWTSTIPEGFRRYFDAGGKLDNMGDLVRAVVFQSLKQLLGGQFTKEEAVQLVNATWNEQLPDEVNVKRIERLRDEIVRRKLMHQDQMLWYSHNRTFAGYEPLDKGCSYRTIYGVDAEERADELNGINMGVFRPEDYDIFRLESGEFDNAKFSAYMEKVSDEEERFILQYFAPTKNQ